MRTLVVSISFNRYLRHTKQLVQFDQLEMVKLCTAAGYQVGASMEFSVSSISPGMLLAKGRIQAIKERMDAEGFEAVVFNASLTAMQERNISSIIKQRVLNRNHVILELFSKHASSADSKLQVALAKLELKRAQLVGSWTHLERQRGSVGTRAGPGETQLESDRRDLNRAITTLRRKIKQIKRRRLNHRQNRRKRGVFKVALVGYTNSGKTSLFNALSGAQGLVADQWFATLDPLIRRVYIPEVSHQQTVVAMDTVGFISHMPQALQRSFSATLEEICDADLLLHVIDRARSGFSERMNTVNQQLEALSVWEAIPIVQVFNKIDLLGESPRSEFSPGNDSSHTQAGQYRIYLSAHDKSALYMLQNIIRNQISFKVK